MKKMLILFLKGGRLILIASHWIHATVGSKTLATIVKAAKFKLTGLTYPCRKQPHRQSCKFRGTHSKNMLRSNHNTTLHSKIGTKDFLSENTSSKERAKSDKKINALIKTEIKCASLVPHHMHLVN
jgi:hypothetical protein